MSTPEMILLVTISFVATAAAAGGLVAWRRSQVPGVARRMATGLGLDRRARRELALLAGHAGLDQPTALLISRGCFDAALDRIPEDDRPAFAPALRDRLFGS